jgi:hypothetical protein
MADPLDFYATQQAVEAAIKHLNIVERLKNIQERLDKRVTVELIDSEKAQMDAYNLGFEDGQKHTADYMLELARKMREDMTKNEDEMGG